VGLRERNLKTIAITSHIRCRVPEGWSEIAAGRGVRLRTPEGGTVSATAREFQKPARPGMGAGGTSEQMLSAQVAEFGQVPRVVAPGRAYASHSIPIGEPGHEVECRAWHLVNQAGAWHHETVMVSYEPAPGGTLEGSVIEVLDAEVPRCEFDRSFAPAASVSDPGSEKAKPWWRIW
jgi:hypothetical protein